MDDNDIFSERYDPGKDPIGTTLCTQENDEAKEAEGLRRRGDTVESELQASAADSEFDELKAENATLKGQIKDLHVILAKGVLTELSQLRDENEEFKSRAGVVADTYLKEYKGVAAILEAPYDLFIIFYIKAAEIAAYFGFSYVFVPFVSDEFEMDDSEAGALYAAYGCACTVVGLGLGFLIDRLGVRRSMIIGCIFNTLFRLICALSSRRALMWFVTCTIAPIGASFGVPVLALAIRRYTHKDNRSFAFSFFYSMLCLGCLFGSVTINLVRDIIGEETTLFDYVISWKRMVVIVCALITASTIPAACFIRDIQVLSEFPLRDHEFCKFKPVKQRISTAIHEIVKQSKFWRLAAVTGVFVGVRMTFRHLDATFPKYFLRTYGPQAPFELILAINPITEMIGTPMMTSFLVTHKVSMKKTLLYGAFISGASVFALSIWESYFGAIAFVLILSFGDTIWSPKLYEFSTMAAAEGKEGMYLAITMAPMYLAALPVGLLSGALLKAWCPKDSTPEQRHSQLMWFVIGLTSFASPVAFYFLQNKLIHPDDEQLEGKSADGEGSAADPEQGEGEHRRPRRLRVAGKSDLPLAADDMDDQLEDEADSGKVEGVVVGRPDPVLDSPSPRSKAGKKIESVPLKQAHESELL